MLEKVFFFFYGYSLKLCLWIAHRKNKILKILLFVVCSPYLFVKGGLAFLYEITIGRAIVKCRLSREEGQKYKWTLGIVAIAKNEVSYVNEWIAYYLAVCDYDIHIYLYDNESDDGLKDAVQKYVEAGYVDYFYYPGVKKQLPAYNDALEKYKNDVKYMAFVDLDEFIVPHEDVNLSNCIDELIEKNKACGIGINWKMYGSSGYKERGEGFVIERFLKRGSESFWGNEHIKTVANPRLVKKVISCHYPLYVLGGWSVDSKGKHQRLWTIKPVDWSELAINHYFCKSEEEFWKKRNRGRATTGGKYDFDRFIDYDRNEYDDAIMLRYVEKVKSVMRKIES